MIKKLDIFGSQISLRFQGKHIHKTKFGAFITLSLICLISIRFTIILTNKIKGVQPEMLFQERVVHSQDPFLISPKTFQIAFAIQNTSYVYTYDERIFTIQGTQSKKTMKLNTQTNLYEPFWVYTKFKLEKCTKEHIVHPETIQFFDLSHVQDHYCLPKDMQLQIQGEFNSDEYSEIVLKFKRCSDANCLPDQQIDALLNNHYVEALFTDVIIQPENKQNPFKPYARDLYWSSSNQLPRTVNMYLRNNYIESDFGWFSSDLNTQVFPTFSFQDSQIVSTKSDFFFKYVIRFEKQKENYYKRSYQNAFQIISELGGFTQILLAGCFFICSAYSQLHLNKTIIDETFNFHEFKDVFFDQACNQSNNLSSDQKDNHQIDSQQMKDFIIEDPSNIQQNEKEIKQTVNQQQLPNAIINNKQSLQQSYTFENFALQNPQYDSNISLRTPIEIKNNQNKNNNGKHSYNIEMEDQSKNSSCNETKMKQSLFSDKSSVLQDSPEKNTFIKRLSMIVKRSQVYYFQKNTFNDLDGKSKQTQFDKYVKETEIQFKKLMDKTSNMQKSWLKKKVIDYSIDTLYKHLDLQYIIKKLIEVEKLKKIILDKDQLNLFEILPKPSINYSFLNNKEVIINNTSNNLFYHDQRSDLEKMNNAVQSLRNIIDINKISKIDNQIIQMIDENFQKLLQQTLKQTE